MSGRKNGIRGGAGDIVLDYILFVKLVFSTAATLFPAYKWPMTTTHRIHLAVAPKRCRECKLSSNIDGNQNGGSTREWSYAVFRKACFLWL